MREDTLRAVLMVRAIEDVDHAGTILPPGDRARATREAMRAQGVVAGGAGDGALDAAAVRALGDRAERLVAPLVERHPVVAEVLGRTRTPAWILLALLVLAFAAGIGLSALDGSRRINILAFPFIGLIAWNLAAYVALAVMWLRRRRGEAVRAFASARWTRAAVARRLGPLVQQTARVHAVLGQAIGAYVAGWTEAGGAFIAQHARRWLHLAAAAVALGLITGLYLRGTVLRYEAGWESTFLGPASVKTVLGLLYGPVAAWSGVALPGSVGEVAALRWTASGGGGDAAPWIHLIALSLACYVVIPRLLLAGLATLSLGWLGRPGTLPPSLGPYAAGVLRGGGVLRAGGVASVTPYAYEPSEAALAGLEHWLAATAQGPLRIERRSSLRYGEEDMAAPGFGSGAHRVADLHVVLMNLAATPEAENHGVVIAAARDAARRARPPAAVRVVVDESPYAARFAGDSSLAGRLDERRRLWREFVAGYGIEADVIALEDRENRGHAPNFSR
jgi:cytochrome b subunit of formate dehydrogenase